MVWPVGDDRKLLSMGLHYRLRDINKDLNYERQRKTGGADTTIRAAANCLLLPYSSPLSPVVFIEQTVTRPKRSYR